MRNSPGEGRDASLRGKQCVRGVEGLCCLWWMRNVENSVVSHSLSSGCQRDGTCAPQTPFGLYLAASSDIGGSPLPIRVPPAPVELRWR